ncbi:DUF4013 domain-containing protein [Chloroflexota bacterium]
MDIGKSFTFVFEDKDWITKILIAAAILLVGVIFSWMLLIPLILAYALLSGYGVEILRQVVRGDLDKLPEWDDWGALLIEGVKVIVIGLVYALPLIIVAMCLGVPIGALSEDASGASSVLGLFLGCITFLYAIAMSVVYPAAVAHYAVNDDLGAAFRFGEVFGLVSDNLSTYLITFVMSWVASFIGSLGNAVCGVGGLVTIPYSLMVIGHLYGQAYVQATGQAPAPAPPELEEEVEEEVEEAVDEEVA